MEKKAQFEFDNTMLVAIVLGLLAGGIALFVAKSSPVGAIYKIITFIFSAIAGGIVSYMILNKQ